MNNLKKPSTSFQNWFSTESVNEGHPDKIADQIAETILDYVIKLDPEAHVACEVIVMNKKIMIGGEIKMIEDKLSKNFYNEIINLTKKVIKQDIQYLEKDWNNLEDLIIEVFIQTQSSEIDEKVAPDKTKIGAGDNSTVYGWAEQSSNSNHFPIFQYLANEILKAINTIRKNSNAEFSFAPDGKIQIVTCNDTLKKIVLCQQFNNNVKKQNNEETANRIKTVIITPLLERILDKAEDFDLEFIPFYNGGPVADTGLTGRKIAVDNYGTYVRHGGGSFSGKDITKSDRSLALFARFVSKNIIFLNLASSIEIQITSQIGQTQKFVFGYSATNGDEEKILKILAYFSEWSFKDIIDKLQLQKVSFQKFSHFGYFGRDDFDAFWEQDFLLPILKKLM